MKVLITLSQLRGHGGIPRFNQNLLDAIGDQHDMNVLSLNDPSDAAISGANRNKLVFLVKFFLALFLKPKVIVLGHINLLPALVFKFVTKAKIVVILHGIDAWNPKKGSDRFYEKVDEFWSVSQFTKNKFRDASDVEPGKVKKIFNTLPKTWSLDTPQGSDKNFFFSVTRVDKSEGYKGIDKTIEAVSRLQDFLRELKWKYVAVLSGDDVERHRNLAVSHGITDLVDFQSTITDDTLKQLYAECSFFILPSSGEGFGIVFLEAMSYSKPCVGALGCGSEDVIENAKTGYLIEPTVQQIEEAVQLLVQDVELRKKMGLAGHNKLRSEFSFDKFQNTINEYLRICAE